MEEIIDAVFLGGARKEQKRMAEARRQHEKTLERKEALQREEVANLTERLNKVVTEEMLERERAAKNEEELCKMRESNIALHAKQLKSSSDDLRNRIERHADRTVEMLKNAQMREDEEKQRLVERNTGEKIRMEQRRKEKEAELAQKMKELETEKKKLNERKMSDMQKNSKQLDEVKSKHFDDLRVLKEEQMKVVMESSEIKMHYQARHRALSQIEATGQAELRTAYDQDIRNQHFTSVLNDLKSESNELLEIVHKITPYKLNQKCITSVIRLKSLILSVFGEVDDLDENRTILAEQALLTLDHIDAIIREWATKLKDMTSIESLKSNLKPLENFVRALCEQTRKIPYPNSKNKDFNSVVSKNCAMMMDGSVLDKMPKPEQMTGFGTPQMSILEAANYNS